MDRQTIANLVPLVAVVIALAEYLFDHTTPRYAGPWFWIALVVTVGMLVLLQVFRLTGASKRTTAKPDYSAAAVLRRRGESDDRG